MSSPTQADNQLDVLIVGGGFSGIYQLHTLRKRGYSVKIVERGTTLGGTWYLNRYPGARVDSDVPIYELGIEELWKDWTWTERFPDWRELQAYFRYVDKKLDISRDVYFNTRVVGARFDLKSDRWIVDTEGGRTFSPRFLSLCTGFASRNYTPAFAGLETFKGVVHHTSDWPEEGVDVAGKRVGVIGTGSSGVQVIQEVAPIVEHLTVFQRTPNLALPMVQRTLTAESQEKDKKDGLYQVILNRRFQTFGGVHFAASEKNTFDVTPEERRMTFERSWADGGFRFWLGGYADLFTSQESNDVAYAFWRDKVRARINDKALQEKLAPWKKPHPFGCKRPCLEQEYFEVYNRPNVTLIDVSENGIVEVTPRGVLTRDRQEHELDVLVLATGFDSVTGGITQIDIVGTDGVSIRDKWGQRLQTYLGLTTTNFPNMFWAYGPHGPTAFSNGPTCVEMQSNWIVRCLDYMKSKGFTRIEAQKSAEDEWTKLVQEKSEKGLWAQAKSWYMGANIPGKRVEPLNWTGGVPLYHQICEESAREGYKGFVLA